LNFQQHPCDNITLPEVYSGRADSITLQNEQIRIPNLGLLWNFYVWYVSTDWNIISWVYTTDVETSCF